MQEKRVSVGDEESEKVRLMPFSVPPEHRQQLLENLQRNVIFVF